MKFWIFTIVLFLAGPIYAVDPECVDVTQAPELDWSDGDGGICLSQTGENGDSINDSKTVNCTVKFFNESGTEIGSQDFSGPPGSFHTFNVPRDGFGSATASCVLDNLTSAETNVVILYPVATPPAPPLVLP